MNLQIDCTWNNNKEKGKVIITFDHTPKSFFSIKSDVIKRIKSLEKSCLLDGPVGLKELEKIQKENPSSLYAGLIYFQALRSFEFFDEALRLFQKMKKKFPEEVTVKSIAGHYLLEQRKLKDFMKMFEGREVLTPAFPDRSAFYYQEALLFHFVWDRYHTMQKDVFQAEKHKEMVQLLIDASEHVLTPNKKINIST